MKNEYFKSDGTVGQRGEGIRRIVRRRDIAGEGKEMKSRKDSLVK